MLDDLDLESLRDDNNDAKKFLDELVSICLEIEGLNQDKLERILEVKRFINDHLNNLDEVIEDLKLMDEAYILDTYTNHGDCNND